MKTGGVLLLGFGCLIGMIADGLASIFGLIAWMDVDYWLARALIACVGVIVTCFVAATKFVIRGEAHGFLCLVWLMAVVVDVATTSVGLVHFLVNRSTLEDAVPVTVDELIQAVEANPDRGIPSIVFLILITGATMGFAYCIESAESISDPKI